MAEKAQCRWLHIDMDLFQFCFHPLITHLSRGHAKLIGGGQCHGCPCHEPEPAKDTQRTDQPQVDDKP